MTNFKINFISSKASFRYSYEPSKQMQKPIFKLYKWILKEHNDINVLLTKTNQVFFNNIKCFCEDINVNYKEPLFLHAYIDEEKQLNLKIESGNYNEYINFDRSIFGKITCEHNLNKKLTSEELNNLFNSDLTIKK